MRRQRRGAIPAPILPTEQRFLKFSFKHLDLEHRKFQLTACDVDFLRNFVQALQRYANYTVDQFTDQNIDEFRHTFDFTQAMEDGFSSLSEELRQELPWQFAICPDTHAPPHSAWRVYGFILEDVFYVVWLDTRHQLFPDGKFRVEVGS